MMCHIAYVTPHIAHTLGSSHDMPHILRSSKQGRAGSTGGTVDVYTQKTTDQVFSLLTIQASDNYMYPIKHIYKLFSQYLYFLVDRV